MDEWLLPAIVNGTAHNIEPSIAIAGLSTLDDLADYKQACEAAYTHPALIVSSTSIEN